MQTTIGRPEWLPDYLRRQTLSAEGKIIAGPLNAAADEIERLKDENAGLSRSLNASVEELDTLRAALKRIALLPEMHDYQASILSEISNEQ